MKVYLRNLLLLSLVASINYIVFTLVSNRKYEGQTTMKNVELDEVAVLRKENQRLRDVIRAGGQEQEPKLPHMTGGQEPEPKLPHMTGGNQPEIPKLNVMMRQTNVTIASKEALQPISNASRVEIGHPIVAYSELDKRDVLPHINPHRYKLMIDEKEICYDAAANPKEVFLIVLISTIHKNFEQRRVIRETWGSPKVLLGKRVVTLFMLAHNSDAHLQELLQEESDEHHDILQEDFQDSYKNLTLKTVMGMKWVGTHCPHAAYLMKTDDDMFISYQNLVQYLVNPKTPTSRLAFGFLIHGGPIRDPKNKWYMSKAIYPGSMYPPFLSGTGYVFSVDLAKLVYSISLDMQYLHLEDVFMATCLKKLEVTPIKHREFNNWHTPYSYCRFHKLITTHMVTPSQMSRIWLDQKRQQTVVCS